MVEILASNVPSEFAAMRLAREVRSHGRSKADIVLFASDQLISVEVKLSDWKRAIYQAVLNRYCVDRSYIALWKPHVTSEVLCLARSWGLGVMCIGPSAVQVLEEAPATTPDPELRERLLAHLASRQGGE